jgi:signal transduction histidine kinase
VPEGATAHIMSIAAVAAAEAAVAAVRDAVAQVTDEEIGALLPAPGFPQTLPDGKAWRAFLATCVEHGYGAATLPLRADEPPLIAAGYAWGADAVLVLLGGSPVTEDVAWLRAILPILVATFRGEQIAAHASVQVRMAQESAARAATIARMLDRTRVQLEDALLAARQSREHLTGANIQLQEQAVKLAMQADELHVANVALSEARRVADAANKAKSEFLATMSHELRTPLNAIGGHAQLIEMGLRGPVTQEQRDALERIDRSRRHLLSIINDILNLSRIEAGHVEYHLAVVSLRDAFDDIAPMIEPQLAARELAYEIRDAGSLPTVRADREKLQQILLNLLSNAVKFTEPGGRVWIEAEWNLDHLRGMVGVHVADTGRGIPEDRLAFIFEPFTQVDASHSRVGQGTGLGLAISRDLARGMGGDLTVRSTLGIGSTFTLTLPAS